MADKSSGFTGGFVVRNPAETEDLARRIVNKLLHDPVQTLRSPDAGHSPGIQYLHALEKLFKLNE